MTTDALVRSLLQETYSSPNLYLLQYLRQKPLDISNHWEVLASSWNAWDEWLEQAGSSRDEMESLAAADDVEAVWEICYRVEALLDDGARDEAAEILVSDDPSEAPTWAYLDAGPKPELLPASTWLTHWSRNAEEIAANGFSRGVDDITRLGLTNYLGQSARSRPGYNFAFRALQDDNEGERYGRSCVAFQSSGVEAWHHGDEEDQVIFWGPAVTTPPVLVAVDRHDDRERWAVWGRNGRPVVRLETAADCFRWLARHAQRYRGALYGR